jgi:hypothetical protein
MTTVITIIEYQASIICPENAINKRFAGCPDKEIL